MRQTCSLILSVVLCSMVTAAARGDSYTFTNIKLAGEVEPGAYTVVEALLNNSGQVFGNFFGPSSAEGYFYSGGVAKTINPEAPCTGNADASTCMYPGALNDKGQALAGQNGQSFIYYDGHWTTIKAPNGTDGQAYALNDSGLIVGTYWASGGIRTFSYLNGIAKPGISDPNAGWATYPQFLNDAGQIAGGYDDKAGKSHEFFYTNGHFNDVNVPGGANTEIYSMNNAGQLIGQYSPNGKQPVGRFFYSNGVYTRISMPGNLNNSTSITGFNNSGEIIGEYEGKDFQNHVYLYSNGHYADITAPGADYTSVVGINDSGEVLGIYTSENIRGYKTFVYKNGEYTTVDEPGAAFSEGAQINNAGQIVGGWWNDSQDVNLFLATPTTDTPEPATFALISFGLLGLGVSMRTRR